jgi:hypothetical protein
MKSRSKLPQCQNRVDKISEFAEDSLEDAIEE